MALRYASEQERDVEETRGLIRQGDLGIIMKSYEEELAHPIYNSIRGT